MTSTRQLHAIGRRRRRGERIAIDLLWRLRNVKLAMRALLRRVVLACRRRPRGAPVRLHVGSGSHRLEGWVNIDIEALPGVDRVADVTRGLPFEAVECVFAEHFLEHLAVDDAMAFLLEVHRVLAPGGWLRLTTPNLEWVLATHYSSEGDDTAPGHGAVAVNRAFFGWGHQFLWDRALLGEALACCGFEQVRWSAYGDSEIAALRGVEGHECYGDSADHMHVLVVEATRGRPQPRRLAELVALLQDGFLHHCARDYSEAYWREAWWRDRRPAAGGGRRDSGGG